MNTNHQLFVYGSLRKGFEHPAFQYIAHYFHFVGPAKAKGVLYDLGEYPAAIPCSDEHFLIGELYAINEADEFGYAIAQLDDYEGSNPEEGHSLYRREITAIYTETGTTEAWVYWYNDSIEGNPLILSGDLLAYIKERNP